MKYRQLGVIMRTPATILISILTVVILGELWVYLQDPQPMPVSSNEITPTIAVPTLAPRVVYEGTVTLFQEDTGESGRYAYYVEFVNQNGEMAHFRFPKKDMNNLEVQHYDTAGNLVKEGALESGSIIKGDMITIAVHQHELEPGSPQEPYFNVIFDKIDVRVTRP